MNNKRVYKMFCCGLLLCLFLWQPFIASAQDELEVVESDSASYFEKIDTASIGVISERKVPDSLVKRLQNDEDFWYANTDIVKTAPKKQSPFLFRLLQQPWLRTLLWVMIAAAFVVVLIWYLATFNIRLFHKPSASIKHNEENEIGDNIFLIDYEKELDKALRRGHYNLAVRLLYLRLLTQMSDKGIIQYGQDRTNSDYLTQLFQTSYYKDFFKLTREFEYSWYGQFSVSATTFETINKDFENFTNRLRF